MSTTVFSRHKKRGRPASEVVKGTVGALVRKARNEAGLNSTDLAEKVGITQSSISRIEGGKIEPDKTTLIRLAQVLGTSFGEKWLEPHAKAAKSRSLDEGEAIVYFGDEEHRIINRLAKQEGRTFAEQARELALEALMQRRLITDTLPQSDVVFLADYLPQPKKMRLLGAIAAGEPIDVYPQSESIEVPAYKLKPGREYFVLRVQGNSMIDEGMHDGSFIICEVAQTAKRGDRIVALIDGDKATVKKYYPERGRIRLQPANKLHQPIYVQPDKLRIQGIVIGTWRPSS